MSNEPNAEHAVATGRIDQWHSVVQAELQSLVKQASAIRKNIDGAKTDYKKQYFKKKFEKCTKEVLSMVATLQRLEERKSSMAPVMSAVVDQAIATATPVVETSDAIIRGAASHYVNPLTVS